VELLYGRAGRLTAEKWRVPAPQKWQLRALTPAAFEHLEALAARLQAWPRANEYAIK
jgi:hypothetical protein